MEKERILTQVGWLTNIKTEYIPPKTQEEVERIRTQENEYYRNMFKVRVMFLQEKGLTTKIILSENDIVDEESKLSIGDLTEDGFRFYRTTIDLMSLFCYCYSKKT